jgi:hypothetical protein
MAIRRSTAPGGFRADTGEKIMSLEVLTPESPRWDVFVAALQSALEITPESWRCDGDQAQAGPNVYRYAKQVMTEMGNINIAESIALFESLGGYCDCEILFNVDS